MSRLWLRLYPRSWRSAYGREIEAELKDTPTTISMVLDLMRGALDAWWHPELAALRTSGSGATGRQHRLPRAIVIAGLATGLALVLVASLPEQTGPAGSRNAGGISLSGGVTAAVSRTAPAYKLRIQREEEASQAAAEAGPRVPKPAVPLAPAASCPNPPGSLRPRVLPTVGPYPLGGGEAVMDSSAYGGVVGSYYYGLWAGYMSQAPLQGVVLVSVQPLDPCAQGNFGSVKLYVSPIAQGAITFTGITDGSATFTTSSGAQGVVNFVTGTFSPG